MTELMPDHASKSVLAKISTVLGCDPEAFIDPRPNRLSQTQELVSLCLLIENADDREIAISFLSSLIQKSKSPAEAVVLSNTLHKPD